MPQQDRHGSTIEPVSNVSRSRSPSVHGSDGLLDAAGSDAARRYRPAPRTTGGPGGPARSREAVDGATNLVPPPARIVVDKDDDSGRTVVRLAHAETGDVIRQIPPEEMLRIAESVDRFLGLVVDRHS